MSDAKKQILVCDDNDDIVGLVFSYLRSQGYEVAVAYGEDTFWDKMKRMKFDLIVLDIMMPGQDGFSIAQALRDKGDNTPIVFMTGHKTFAYRLQGPLLPKCDYIIKPFELEMLLAKMQHLLNGQPGPLSKVGHASPQP